MLITHDRAPLDQTSVTPPLDRWIDRPVWNRLRPLQLLVMSLATLPLMLIVAAFAGRLAGVVSFDTMIELALAGGEDPGMFVFGAMFLASPVQWAVGRSQVRVRKYLGIVFFLLSLSNGVMFVLESGLADSLSEPFLVAGTAAVVLATPLFLTSSHRAQRTLGLRRWRLLHKLTYVIAVALVAHVVLMPEIALGVILIMGGFVARIPAIRRWLKRTGAKRSDSASVGLGDPTEVLGGDRYADDTPDRDH